MQKMLEILTGLDVHLVRLFDLERAETILCIGTFRTILMSMVWRDPSVGRLDPSRLCMLQNLGDD